MRLLPPSAAFLGVFLLLGFAAPSAADDALAEQLTQLDSRIVTDAAKAKQLATMVGDDIRARRQAANQRETTAWREVKTRGDWERFRDARVQALRDSLGAWPPVPTDLKVRRTRTIDGDGYRIENLVFESRPGLMVTANLYAPAEPAASMPGIVICPSHHNPKTQGELQDMGMSWARLGCVVIVPDNLGHGERRQHPFRTAADYAGKFVVGRQDYHFRYNVGMQLHLAGESLIGWIVGDLMRCVDVLLARPGVDRDRILLLGAVAGGGDPAAVTAALDPRITAVAPFNFGGPQPETRFPLPDDAEASFNYAGGGSWESTRNLRRSARDGFLPWVIVGAAAPRPLIYAHEFAWDRDHDPVWARLQKIYGFYDRPNHLAEAHGRGSVSGKPPDSTHCNNIGPEHRAAMYPALRRWFRVEFAADKEYRQRHPADDLLCLTPEVEQTLKPKPVHELAAALAAERGTATRQRLAALKPEERRPKLAEEWAKLLGDVEPRAAKATVLGTQNVGDATVERVLLETEPGITVPLLLLRPRAATGRLPLVVGVAPGGKQAFLKERSTAIAELLRGGGAVCLPDVRGTGESKLDGDSHGRQSASTGLSSSELMLGGTMLGTRLRDLRSVLKYLRGRPEFDAARIGLWGESFAPINARDRELCVPLDAEKQPDTAEPLGSLLALFAALYEPDVRAVSIRDGLSSFASILHGQFCYVPHDVIVPGALTLGDLGDVTAVLAPRRVRLAAMVDGLNRRVTPETLAKDYEPALRAYRAAGADGRLELHSAGREPPGVAWLLAAVKGD